MLGMAAGGREIGPDGLNAAVGCVVRRSSFNGLTLLLVVGRSFDCTLHLLEMLSTCKELWPCSDGRSFDVVNELCTLRPRPAQARQANASKILFMVDNMEQEVSG